MLLEQLIYISVSTIVLGSPLDLADILQVSAQNNAEHRITGALTYSGDHFVQLLEGPSAALDSLMGRLFQDPRHTDLKVMGRVDIRERAFPEWSMLFPGFTPATTAALATLIADGRRQLPAYREVLLQMAREQGRTLRGM